MAKIILTGGAGFIGSHTYIALIKAGFDVIILDNFSNSKRSILDRLSLITKQDVIFEEINILDLSALDAIFAKYKPNGVIHFAASKAVGESVQKPLEYFENNIKGLLNLLRAMKDHGSRNLVFSSSATVYGMQDHQPISENASRSYTNPYGFTKLSSEQMLEQISSAEPNWNFGILRYFNPVGAHDSGIIGEDPNDTPNNLMPYIAKVASGELDSLNIFGNDYKTKDGTGIRDYIHVCDLADAHVKSLQALENTSKNHTLNIGTGHGSSVFDVLNTYSIAANKKLAYKIVARREGDVKELIADVENAKTVLKFKAQRDLKNMCETSWRWIQFSREKNTD